LEQPANITTMSGFVSDLASAFSGATGQFVGSIVVFPVDVVKTRMMASKTTITQHQFTLLVELIRREGLLNVYSRFPAKGLQQGASRFTFYYFYSFLTRAIRPNNGRLGFWANLLVGYLSAVINTLPSNPLEIIAVQAMKDKNDRSIPQIIADIYQQEGMEGFYKGWRLNFITSLNPAIQNTLFDQIKSWWLYNKKRSSSKLVVATTLYLTLMESFWLGAFSKAIATVATFPFSRAKVMVASGGGGGGGGANIFKVLWLLYHKDGMAGLFQGLMPSLTKSVSQSAFMLMVKEKVDEYSRAFVLSLLG